MLRICSRISGRLECCLDMRIHFSMLTPITRACAQFAKQKRYAYARDAS
jgi:hypothetical protein